MARSKVTQQDLEQVMNLDNWLITTDTVRKNKELGYDAWAEGSTDCAFQINNITGVQRSRRSNDWNYWGDLSQKTDDNGNDYGTYLNFMSENRVVDTIFTQVPQVVSERKQVHDNTNGSGDISYEYTETETNTVMNDVTITNSVSLSMETGVDVKGFSIKISSTFEHTKATMNSETTSVEKSEKVTGTVAAGKYLEVHTLKLHGEKRYRVRIPVIMEGWVGLCTADGDKGNFVPYPLYDFVDKKKVTRWMKFDMLVGYTSQVVKTYSEPTDLSVSKQALIKI